MAWVSVHVSSEHIFVLFVPPRLLTMRRHKIANNATLHSFYYTTGACHLRPGCIRGHNWTVYRPGPNSGTCLRERQACEMQAYILQGRVCQMVGFAIRICQMERRAKTDFIVPPRWYSKPK